MNLFSPDQTTQPALLDLSTVPVNPYWHPYTNFLTLTLDYDEDAESPNDDENWWQVRSFSDRHTDHLDRDTLLDDSGYLGIGWRSKLRHGTAFWLYGLYDTTTDGGDDPHNYSGIVYFTGKPSDLPRPDDGQTAYARRYTSAKAHVETYEQWVNGNCYMWQFNSPVEANNDGWSSCIGSDWTEKEINMECEAQRRNRGFMSYEYIKESDWLDHEANPENVEPTEYGQPPVVVHDYTTLYIVVDGDADWLVL